MLVLIVLLWVRKSYKDSHYFDNYDPKAPLNVAELESTDIAGDAPEKAYKLTRFTFDGYHGEKVPSLMAVPQKNPGGAFPAVIFLHGIGQNKNFLKDIALPFVQCGFVLVSFDQYTQGERKIKTKESLLYGLDAFGERPAKTINETRRLIDYLSTLSYIDPSRIYLVGASYGAVTGSTVLAKDKRLHAGVLVYGGGNLGKLLRSDVNRLGVAAGLGLIDVKNISPEKGPLPKLSAGQSRIVGCVLALASPVVRYFYGVADPIHYVDKIAPTPVYFQNGDHDALVPAPAGVALQEAAKEPKKITWYNSDHVGLDIKDTQRVLADGLRWLLEQDNPLRKPESRVKSVPTFEFNRK
jgi:dienelactone hydrolase